MIAALPYAAHESLEPVSVIPSAETIPYEAPATARSESPLTYTGS